MDTRINRCTFWVALVCAIIPASARADGEPAKLASTARFDLSGDARVGSLEAGRVVAGSGTIMRMNWVPEAQQPRGYTVSLPVTHVGWHSLTVGFTPLNSGTVTLSLMWTTWEEASKGVVYRQEIFLG